MEKNSVLNKVSVIVFAFVFLVINIVLQVTRPISNLDEIWNYNLANQMLNGLIPYKDISMIITPASSFFMAIGLKLVANSLLVYRVIAGFFITALLIISYKILEKLTKNKLFSLLAVFIIELIFYDFFTYDYNFLIPFLGEIILYLEIKKYFNNKDVKLDFIIGLIAGISICTKHTVGAFIALAVVVLVLFYKKSNKNEKIKAIITRIIGISIPALIMFIYLLINGAFGDFINYAILGVSEFSNSISYGELFSNEKTIIKILAVIMPIFLLLCAIFLLSIKKQNTETDILEILIIYSLPLLIMIYPISDDMHFLVGTYILLLTLFYVIYRMMESIKINEKIKKYLYNVIIIISIIIVFIILANKTTEGIKTYMHSEKININHYESLIIPKNLEKRIINVNNKINKLGNDRVYIIDTEAAVYNIALDRYYKDYDMLNKGNFGKNGEDRLINQIKESKNSYFLIRKEGIQHNWQLPVDVVNYIRANFEKIGEVEIFDIYYNNSEKWEDENEIIVT